MCTTHWKSDVTLYLSSIYNYIKGIKYKIVWNTVYSMKMKYHLILICLYYFCVSFSCPVSSDQNGAWRIFDCLRNAGLPWDITQVFSFSKEGIEVSLWGHKHKNWLWHQGSYIQKLPVRFLVMQWLFRPNCWPPIFHPQQYLNVALWIWQYQLFQPWSLEILLILISNTSYDISGL